MFVSEAGFNELMFLDILKSIHDDDDDLTSLCHFDQMLL